MVAVLFPLLIISAFSPASARTGLRVGDPFPGVSLRDLNGKPVILPDDAAGKVVVVHFWASWCPLCVREMAAIQSVMAAFREKGLVAYSINSGESAEAARTYVEKTKATHPILLDPAMAITTHCGIISIPTTFICDRDGKIRYKILGEINEMGLEKLLSTLL